MYKFFETPPSRIWVISWKPLKYLRFWRTTLSNFTLHTHRMFKRISFTDYISDSDLTVLEDLALEEWRISWSILYLYQEYLFIIFSIPEYFLSIQSNLWFLTQYIYWSNVFLWFSPGVMYQLLSAWTVFSIRTMTTQLQCIDSLVLVS